MLKIQIKKLMEIFINMANKVVIIDFLILILKLYFIYIFFYEIIFVQYLFDYFDCTI